MSSSPFEALTRRERQERWLEFQNTRLPYVTIAEQREPAPTVNQPSERQPEIAAKPPTRERQDFNRVRHRQYDAVIRRMRQAERQATSYQRAD